MEAFERIMKEANRVGWPKHYKDDLFKHDKERLSNFEGDTFGWILRECGTFLYDPRINTTEVHVMGDHFLNDPVGSNTKGKPYKFYIHKHGKLKQYRVEKWVVEMKLLNRYAKERVNG